VLEQIRTRILIATLAWLRISWSMAKLMIVADLTADETDYANSSV